jgi:hypothetical protein
MADADFTRLRMRPNVALVASDAPKAALGASDAPKATLGRFTRMALPGPV